MSSLLPKLAKHGRYNKSIIGNARLKSEQPSVPYELRAMWKDYSLRPSRTDAHLK